MDRNSKFLICSTAFFSLAITLTNLFLEKHSAIIISLFLSASLLITVIINLRSRRKKVLLLSNLLTSLMNGKEEIDLSRFEEGELYILENEIIKIIINARNYQSQIIKEKAMLSRYIADISHQIKTPLTSMNLIDSMLSNPDTSKERKNELLLQLRVLHAKIEKQISTLLKLSRLDAEVVEFEKRHYPLKSLLKLALEPVLLQADIHEITIEKDIEGNCYADLHWTAEALTNIIKNCVEHSPKGSIVNITAEENNIYSQIQIKDMGEGVPKEELASIFDRFYQSKCSKNSTNVASVGIGLSLSKSIIKSQNGIIKAQLNPEGGMLFTIKLYK